MMQFTPYLPAEPLHPYIRQYLHLKAEGSTDLMKPPEADKHFVGGLHTETMLPTIGHIVFVKGEEMWTDQLHIQRNNSMYVVSPRLDTPVRLYHAGDSVCTAQVTSLYWVKATALKEGVDTLHLEYHDCNVKYFKCGAYDVPITVRK